MKSQYPIISRNTVNLPFYITSIGGNESQTPVERKNGYPSHHIFIFLSGSGIFECENKTYTAKAGDAVFLRKNIPHAYYPTEEPYKNVWVTFNGSGCDGLLDYYSGKNFELFHCGDTLDLMPLWKAAAKHIDESKLSFMLYSFIIDFFSAAKNDKKESHLDAAVQFISKNYRNDISLESLAELCHLSRFAFCREFKKTYSVSPFEYLLQVRIQNAKRLIVEKPNLKTSQIAALSGFNDASYFCRTFKRFEHCSPGDFIGK